MAMLPRIMIVMRSLLFSICATVVSASTNSTKLSLYEVEAKIEARFLSGVVAFDIANDQNCTLVKAVTLQLPLHARVTSLQMNMSSGCRLSSEVKSQADAEEMLKEAIASGQAAAMLTAWDIANYDVTVVLPINGSARVEVRYGELLKRRKHKVEFQLPLSPGVATEHITAKVSVVEPDSGVRSLTLGEVAGLNPSLSVTNDLATADIDVVGDSVTLPRLLRASYDAADLPENGLLMTDGLGCIVHLFNPPSLVGAGAMGKHIVFVIDVSGSMAGQKLVDTKVAFASIANMLTTGEAGDTFAVHTFSDKGVEAVWGPNPANADTVASAVEFVQVLETIGGTNLHDAYIDGIGRAKEMKIDNGLPIVLLMTDGQGSKSRTEIASAVLQANEGQVVKIFALAFGRGADLPLLTGIAIENGGIAVQIYEGFGDADTQMENFMEEELGRVLLSDIVVDFEGTEVDAMTTNGFPLLTDGSEISVRAQLNETQRRRLTSISGSSFFKATTRATTPLELTTSAGSTTSLDKHWVAELDLTSPPQLFGAECRLGFAHAKITEIMRFQVAASKLGSSLEQEAAKYLTAFKGQSPTPSPSDAPLDLAAMALDEARSRALEAGLVWPGLTAMITVDSGSCTSATSAEVCGSGSGSDSVDGQELSQSNQESTQSTSSKSATSSSSRRRGGGGGGGSTNFKVAMEDSSYESATNSAGSIRCTLAMSTALVLLLFNSACSD